MSLQVADAFIRLVVDEKELAKAVNSQTGPAATAAGQAGTTVGQRFTKAATAASTAAGAAAGTLFVGAVGAATNFEDQLRTINTVAHLTDAELSGIGKGILDVSRETGKSTDDLTAGFYDLVSAGVPADQALKVLKDSAVFATGALGTTGEAVDVVTSALNAYGLSADQSGKVTDIFAQAVADGKVTAAELGASIANIAPIASSAGISLEEVSTGFAVLTAKGVPASQAATQMRAAISGLLTPNETLNKIQERTGINFAKLAKEKGLAVALEELRKATKGNNDEFAKSLGSIEGYQFALASTGEGAGDFATELEKVTKASEEGGVAHGQYAEQMKSAKKQGDKFLAGVKAFAIEVGGPFVSTLGPAVSVLGQFGNGLGGIFNFAKLAGAGLGGLAGRMVPVLVSALAGVIPAIGGAATAVGSAIAALIPVGMALLPVLLVAAIVAAIVFLINNPEIVDKILEVVGGIIDAFIGALEALVGFVADVFRNIVGAIAAAGGQIVSGVANVVGTIVGFYLSIPGRIIGWIASLLGQAGQVASGVASKVAGLVANVVGFILSIPGKVVAWVGALLGQAGRAAGGIVSAITGGVGKVVGLILGAPGRAIGFVGGMVDLAGKALSGFLDILSALPGKLMDIVTGAIGAAGDAIGNFVGGVGDFLNPFDGKASGGPLSSPVTWVGERGPELLVQTDGYVLDHQSAMEAASSAMGGAGGGGGVTVNVYNPAPEPASTSTKRELRKLEIAGAF